jgi:starch synthase (maltosyl-transferring)
MAQDRDAGRRRVAIEGITPVADGGRWAIKRIQGDRIVVEADVFGDGHDEGRCLLLYRHDQDEQWTTVPLELLGNDRWRATFTVGQLGMYRYTICGWIDHFSTWRHEFVKRVAAGTDVRVDLLIGAQLVAEAANRAERPDAAKLNEAAAAIGDKREPAERVRAALDPTLNSLMEKYPDLRLAVTYDRDLRVSVDRQRAQFSAWYEMFPRSASREPGKHGTFADCQAMSSIFRRFIRSGWLFGRGRTTLQRPRPTTSAAPGALARPREDTRRSIPSWARWKIFGD